VAAWVRATDDAVTLLQTIRCVAGTPVSKQSALGPSGSLHGTSAPRLLSTRQIEILRLLVRGLPHKIIAAELHISPKTVEFHKYRMMRQLTISNSAELILAGIDMGFGTNKRPTHEDDPNLNVQSRVKSYRQLG
jgi:DNA-binding NarL/FixJ family response regulator